MEEQDTLPQAPQGDDVATGGNAQVTPDPSATDAAKTEPQQDTSAPSSVTAESATQADKPSAESLRYLGKKYKDVSEFEEAYDNAQTKIQELGRERNELAEKAKAYEELVQLASAAQDPVQSTPSPELQRLEQEIRSLRRRQALEAEEKALDATLSGKPHLAELRDEIQAAWRLNNKPLGDIITKFEKLVDAGRSQNREDMLRKKEQAVESGKGHGEVSAPADAKGSAFEQAVELSARSHGASATSLKAWADALPKDIGL